MLGNDLPVQQWEGVACMMPEDTAGWFLRFREGPDSEGTSAEFLSFFYFYKFILYIYFLFLAVLGLCCCVWAFSISSKRGLLFFLGGVYTIFLTFKFHQEFKHMLAICSDF